MIKLSTLGCILEAARSPNTKPEDLTKMAADVRDLLAKIQAKNPLNCWW